VGALFRTFLTGFFPAHALLIVEERLKEQQAEGILMPDGIELDELALRILLVAGLISVSPVARKSF
jgi:hypothetical protein